MLKASVAFSPCEKFLKLTRDCLAQEDRLYLGHCPTLWPIAVTCIGQLSALPKRSTRAGTEQRGEYRRRSFAQEAPILPAGLPPIARFQMLSLKGARLVYYDCRQNGPQGFIEPQLAPGPRLVRPLASQAIAWISLAVCRCTCGRRRVDF